MDQESMGTLLVMGVIVAVILGFKVFIHIKSKDVAAKQMQKDSSDEEASSDKN